MQRIDHGYYNGQGTYESRIIKEILMILLAVAIGIVVVVFYIKDIKARRDTAETNDEAVVTAGPVNANAEAERSTVEREGIVKNDKAIEISDTDNNLVSTAADKNEVKKDSVPYVLSIEHLATACGSGVPADIRTYSGDISYDGQSDTYNFIAAYDGPCRIDISGMQYDARVELALYDEFGKVVASDYYCKSDYGITGDLEAGRSYTVKVEQSKGYTGYSLTIGMQKAVVDLTGLSCYSDSIEYKDQCNKYYYTAPVDGLYRFEFSEMYSGKAVSFVAKDSLGATVAINGYCRNGDGVTASDLKAGETYYIEIEQEKDFTSYDLTIWHPKEIRDISEYTFIKDSVEYKEQKNIYIFTSPCNGNFDFEMSELYADAAVSIYMEDRLGETIGANTYCKNGHGFHALDLKAGETYMFYLEQVKGYSDYELKIIKK